MKNALRCFLFMRRLQIASSVNLEQCVCPERLFRLNQPLQLQKARAPHRCSLIPLHIFLKNKSLWRNAQKKKEKTLTQPRRFVTFIRCKVKKPQHARAFAVSFCRPSASNASPAVTAQLAAVSQQGWRGVRRASVTPTASQEGNLFGYGLYSQTCGHLKTTREQTSSSPCWCNAGAAWWDKDHVVSTTLSKLS